MMPKSLSFVLPLIILIALSPAFFWNVCGQTADEQQLFVEPDAGNKPVLDALNNAQESIWMEMYILSDKEILQALKDARSRGLDVRILLEEHPYGGSKSLKAVLDELNSTNISVRQSSPAFRLTHEKGIVIDRKTALIMTLNQGYSAFNKNREFGIIDTNPEDVSEVAGVFEADWNRTSPILNDSSLVWSPVNSRQRILGLIDNAKQTLRIENEEMQDNQVEEHLIAAAAKGVDVQVVMSPGQTGKDANAPGLHKIEAGGVKADLVKSPYIHAKIIVADNSTAFVGSENFSPASLDHNRELGILTHDPGVISQLTTSFEKDWNGYLGVKQRFVRTYNNRFLSHPGPRHLSLRAA
jgi:cardiolipin synthase A/B